MLDREQARLANDLTNSPAILLSSRPATLIIFWRAPGREPTLIIDYTVPAPAEVGYDTINIGPTTFFSDPPNRLGTYC